MCSAAEVPAQPGATLRLAPFEMLTAAVTVLVLLCGFFKTCSISQEVQEHTPTCSRGCSLSGCCDHTLLMPLLHACVQACVHYACVLFEVAVGLLLL